MRTLFVTQCRIACKHGVTDEWDDVCMGHESFDKAVTCQQVSQDALEGKDISRELIDPLTAALMRMGGDMHKAAGNKIELRLIKRTITEEIIDA